MNRICMFFSGKKQFCGKNKKGKQVFFSEIAKKIARPVWLFAVWQT